MHQTELPAASRPQPIEREGSRVAPRLKSSWQQRFGGLVLGIGIFLFGLGVGVWVGDEPPWADPALWHALGTLSTRVAAVGALAAGQTSDLTGLEQAAEPVAEPGLPEPEAVTPPLAVVAQPLPERPRRLVTVQAPSGFTAATLRASPSVSAPSLGLVDNGTRVAQMEGIASADGFEWVQVQTPTGVMGWVVASTIN